MRKIFALLAMLLASTFLLGACTQELVVVDATTLKTSPEKFAGKRIKFYLDGVQGTIGDGSDPSDPLGKLVSLDPRISSDFRITMALKPDLIPMWKGANLQKYHKFTVTLTGTLTPVTSEKFTLYNFSVDEFIINADTGTSPGSYRGAKTADGLPTETLDLPQPTRVDDVSKIGLFPEQFKNKPLQIEAMVSKDDFKPGLGDTVQLRTYALTFVLSKELAASVYNKVNSVSFLEITGTLDSAKAAEGNPVITAKQVRFVR